MSGKNGFQTSAERKENGGCPATAPGAARRCREAACRRSTPRLVIPRRGRIGRRGRGCGARAAAAPGRAGGAASRVPSRAAQRREGGADLPRRRARARSRGPLRQRRSLHSEGTHDILSALRSPPFLPTSSSPARTPRAHSPRASLPTTSARDGGCNSSPRLEAPGSGGSPSSCPSNVRRVWNSVSAPGDMAAHRERRGTPRAVTRIAEPRTCHGRRPAVTHLLQI